MGGKLNWTYAKMRRRQSPERRNAQSGLGNTARTNAARAHTHAFPGFADNNVNVLKIRIPTAVLSDCGHD